MLKKTVTGAPCIQIGKYRVIFLSYYFLMFGDLKLSHETGDSFTFMCRYFYHFSKANWSRYFKLIEFVKLNCTDETL